MVLTSPLAPTKLSFSAPSCSKCSPTCAVQQGWAQRLARHRTGAVYQDFALRGLRFGKLVPTADLDMIRLEPKAQLSGPKLASMDAWDKRHAPDPRSANEGVAIDLTVEQPATLGFQERG